MNRYDVIIVGGGLTGVGAACHLSQKLSHLTYVILEARENLGGTWDHYIFPGVRTDSDSYTMAYSFHPWEGGQSMAPAGDINGYIKKTADKFGILTHVRNNERVEKASWSSSECSWTVISRGKDESLTTFVGSFIFMCSGHTSLTKVHSPDLKGIDNFQGEVVHPQSWPRDIECKDKDILVIGSGATAITIVPALAKEAKHVTMLQRSPNYLLQVPRVNPWGAWLHKWLPRSLAYTVARWKAIVDLQYVYYLASRDNAKESAGMVGFLRTFLPRDYDYQKHFTPNYGIYSKRINLSPDSEFTGCLHSQKLTIVTDTVDHFTGSGVQLRSGQHVAADIVVTATGFDLCALGKVQIEIDGVLQENVASSCMYKGVLLCGVPNMIVALGYLTAAWTLRIDLVCSYACRLLAHMQCRGYRTVCARPPPSDMPLRPIFDFLDKATYIQRSSSRFFRQGAAYPYIVSKNYFWDYWTYHYGALQDQWIEMK